MHCNKISIKNYAKKGIYLLFFFMTSFFCTGEREGSTTFIDIKHKGMQISI